MREKIRRPEFVWFFLCAPWAADRGEDDDDDDDNNDDDDDDDNVNGHIHNGLGLLPGTICDKKSGLPTRPAVDSPSFPWRISRGGYMEWLVCLNMVPLRCPEVFELDFSSQRKFVSRPSIFSTTDHT